MATNLTLLYGGSLNSNSGKMQRSANYFILSLMVNPQCENIKITSSSIVMCYCLLFRLIGID